LTPAFAQKIWTIVKQAGWTIATFPLAVARAVCAGEKPPHAALGRILRACCPNARRGKTSFGRIQNAMEFDQNRTFRVAVAEDGHAPGLRNRPSTLPPNPFVVESWGRWQTKGDAASDMGVRMDEPKRRRRFALPAHSMVGHPRCAPQPAVIYLHLQARFSF